jgi:hypothetical protein
MPYINPGRSPVIVSDEGDLLEAGQIGDLDARKPRVKALADAGLLVKIEAPAAAAKAPAQKED